MEMIDETILTAFMKTQGFVRMEDYHDMGGCAAPIGGDILQFCNPTTKMGVQFCIGDIDDDLMFGEDFRIDAAERCGDKT